MKRYLLPLLLFFIASQSFAQYTVSGRVINKTDNKPVPNAVVFINNSAIASTTDSAGHFKLSAPVGQYHLLVSIVGFESYKTPLTLKGNTILNDIELIPKIGNIKEVTIKAKPTLSSCYPVFETEFFGNTQFARQCKILNPMVLQFYDIKPVGGFSARSSDYIQIENDALGYKVKFLLLYFIKDADKQRCFFNGESFFEEMKGTPKQEREWHKNRLQCYQGSTMHLLRAIISDSLAENGFRVKRLSRKLNPYFNRNGLVADPHDASSGVLLLGGDGSNDIYFDDNTVYDDKLKGHDLRGKDLLLGTNLKGIYAISGKTIKDTSLNSLYIEHIKDVIPVVNGKPVYVHWAWNGTVTVMNFSKRYLIFNYEGKIFNAGAINMDGFMLTQARMATMLPFDYQPME